MQKIYQVKARLNARTNYDLELQEQANVERMTDDAVSILMDSEEELLRRTAIMMAAEEVSEVVWMAWHLTVEQRLASQAAAEQLGISIGNVYAYRSRVSKRIKAKYEALNHD